MLVLCLHNAVLHSVVSHCAHPTVPAGIWARCNSVSWDNSTLGLVVWIGIDSQLLWINLQVNSQVTKLSYFCVETYKWFWELSFPCFCGDYGSYKVSIAACLVSQELICPNFRMFEAPRFNIYLYMFIYSVNI